ncbi:MAG TPA: hypothetical protein VII29_13730 [Terriglobales bacterium]|jgi:hypothetical protein
MSTMLDRNAPSRITGRAGIAKVAGQLLTDRPFRYENKERLDGHQRK